MPISSSPSTTVTPGGGQAAGSYSGTVIMQDGEPGDFFCFLAEGELKVTKNGKNTILKLGVKKLDATVTLRESISGVSFPTP